MKEDLNMVFLPYGRKVKFKDKVMIVSVIGKGDRTIVLLPGMGSLLPVIEYKALSSFMSDRYRIITVEYLGYGMSDKPDIERSLENITGELHHCLECLHCKKYTLVAQSTSGIYCLYYANKYPNEVENFIGIDTSVPYQIDSSDLMEKVLKQ